MSADDRARRTAASHHGVITRSEAHRCGLTDRQILARVRSGAWSRRAQGVFCLSGVPSSGRQRLLVATLRTGGAASHGSAAWLHGIDEEPPARPHVIRCTPGGHHDPSLRLHRSRDLLERDVVTVDSIPVTTAIRTLLDLSATRSDDELRVLVDRARRRRLIHLDRLIARHLELVRRGRPGTARARRVLSALDPALAVAESDLETQLCLLIERAGLPAPVLQHRMVIAGRHVRIDVAYPDRRLAIEGDGFEFHSDRDVFEDDRARQNALVLDGWRVLRFTWRQICCDPEGVAAEIRAALQGTS